MERKRVIKIKLFNIAKQGKKLKKILLNEMKYNI